MVRAGPTLTRVASDDVWVADPSVSVPGGTTSRIWHYDALGILKDTIHIDVGRVFELAFSPTGELHFPVQQGGVYKLVNGQPQLVIPASQTYFQEAGNLVFDRDGYIYAAAAPWERSRVVGDSEYR